MSRSIPTRVGKTHDRRSIFGTLWVHPHACGENCLVAGVQQVSIHASAREATTGVPARRPCSLCFNPRLREGGDSHGWRGRTMTPMFQSTPPRGRRRQLLCCPTACPCFNPRPREGGDIPVLTEAAKATVSIHAPAREATFLCFNARSYDEFQSTPPRGR